MRTKTTLAASDAVTIIAACKVEAVKNKWNVSIAVTDDAGFLLQLERMDGAPSQSPEVATGKARTSAVSRMSTKTLEDMIKERPAFAQIPNRLCVQGGIPVIHNGEYVGAIGVSGVKSHEDEQVAEAGLKALLGS